jgi:uncharacterized protein
MCRRRQEKIMPHGRAPFQKPASAICKLDRRYCYSLSKARLSSGSTFRLSEDMLETHIQQYLESQAGPEVNVSWQGGEPTLMGLDFFRRAVALQQKHRRPGTVVLNTIQTNGTLLDDEWCAFFRDNGFLVGLSLDGPQELHDLYRVDTGGMPTFDRAMRGLRHLQKHVVPVDVLTTVHSVNGDYPLDVYRFLRDEAAVEFIQFTPVVERLSSTGYVGSDPVTDRSVGGEQFGRFLMAVFDEWVRCDIGKVFVQTFDVALAAWASQHQTLCVSTPTCGEALALEHNGDLYSREHPIAAKHLLGNIDCTKMANRALSEQQRTSGRNRLETLPRYCRDCSVRFACNGGCPKDRFVRTPEGEPNLNYLCAGYKAFFDHIDRPMRRMAALLRSGQMPSELMFELAQRAPAPTQKSFDELTSQ